MHNNLYLYPNMVKLRKSKMTQKELADMIGISQQEISRYESGEVKAPVNYIADLAECCGASVDYILGREGISSERSADEEKLVRLYAQLSFENKVRIIERIETLIELQNNKS